MKILVINAGSSTLKFQLIDMDNEKVVAKGNVEKIGDATSFLKYVNNGEYIFKKFIQDHTEAMNIVLEKLLDKEIGVISSVDEIDAFGHRVVNVGEQYFDPIIVTKEILEDFKTKVDFSPLHVPGAIAGIEGAMDASPKTPNVAVFDIGFHKTIPDYAYMYAIPKRYYDEYKIRRYGAHGTSHYFVSSECARVLNKPIEDLKIITCHIGSGASIAAINGGKCIDTSMGFTPLEGIIMNTRSGDIDPAVIEFIYKKEKKDPEEVLKILNKESGLLGICGDISDMRDITPRLGEKNIKLAFDMYCYRIKKYIGSYAASLNGVDALVLTAGCAENTPLLRERICENLDYLGVKLDLEKNNTAPKGVICDLSHPDSKVKILLIPTNEELVIAKETQKLI